MENFKHVKVEGDEVMNTVISIAQFQKNANTCLTLFV